MVLKNTRISAHLSSDGLCHCRLWSTVKEIDHEPLCLALALQLGGMTPKYFTTALRSCHTTTAHQDAHFFPSNICIIFHQVRRARASSIERERDSYFVAPPWCRRNSRSPTFSARYCKMLLWLAVTTDSSYHAILEVNFLLNTQVHVAGKHLSFVGSRNSWLRSNLSS